ncbi:MAG: 4-alpha-glucanotransferase [Thermoanaerobaculia bacterium]
MRDRSAGILLHPSSLPGPYGIGDLGPEVDRFLDWCAEAGQRLWQILPLGPTGAGNSPYGTLSAFAGNPLLISPEQLIADHLLPGDALSDAPPFPGDHVDFGAVSRWKQQLLRDAWSHFRNETTHPLRSGLEAFVRDPRNTRWLDDWTLFAAIKGEMEGRQWRDWPPPLAMRTDLDSARKDLWESIDFHRFVQFVFYRQWERVRQEAHRRGIRIMGDVPIYVALDSADVWANSDRFLLDENGNPIAVAGVPPDYFSPTGQRWGNPLYRWDRMRQLDYEWWVARFGANFRMTDLVRLDHFRGFAAYWEIPAGNETAQGGKWVEGPGLQFFEQIRSELGDLPFVAEDLGEITPDVELLRDSAGLPGMKVLQFAFGEDDSPHHPHNYVRNMVVYTGTHDNDTTRGWWGHLDARSKHRLQEYLGHCSDSVERQLIRAAYTSVADLVVTPLQDVFGLGSEGRMNVPGHPDDNWTWRARHEQFRPEDAHRLRDLARLTGRTPEK